MEKCCVIGYPSRVGGADTELDHQIHVWQALGMEVHIVPPAGSTKGAAAMRLCDSDVLAQTVGF